MESNTLQTSRYPELQMMLDDMHKADLLFRPTLFWESCLIKIVEELEEKGIETFKSHKSALNFFVQRYALDFYLFNKQEYSDACAMLSRVNMNLDNAFEEYVRRTKDAEGDYRVFCAADIPDKEPYLQEISEDPFGEAAEEILFDGKRYSISMLSYLRKLVFLKKHADSSSIRNVMEIGGGYGTLGEILLKADPEKYFYLDVDIPPVAFVSSCYLKKLFGEKNVAGYAETREMEVLNIEELRKKYRALVICPWQLPKVEGSFDLFVNASSFQEMEPDVLYNYAKYIEKLVPGYLLLKNSRAGKVKIKKKGEVGVRDPIVQDDYLKAFDKFELIASDARAFGHIFKRFRAEAMLFKRRTNNQTEYYAS